MIVTFLDGNFQPVTSVDLRACTPASALSVAADRPEHRFHDYNRRALIDGQLWVREIREASVVVRQVTR